VFGLVAFCLLFTTLVDGTAFAGTNPLLAFNHAHRK